MKNPNEEYDRLHDHMTAIARERDNAKRRIVELETRVQNLEAVLKLAQTLLDLD
tara:strand:- start:206 stop:367 length:162 start_codon:yes stop_codon:yes gene_type:complete